MPSPVHYVTAPDGEMHRLCLGWPRRRRVGLRAASSSDVYRAEVEWYGRIRDAHRKGFAPAGVLTLFSRDPVRSAKARGLLPSQALAELAADQDTEGKGRPLPGSLAEAPNADVVKAPAKRS